MQCAFQCKCRNILSETLPMASLSQKCLPSPHGRAEEHELDANIRTYVRHLINGVECPHRSRRLAEGAPNADYRNELVGAKVHEETGYHVPVCASAFSAHSKQTAWPQKALWRGEINRWMVRFAYHLDRPQQRFWQSRTCTSHSRFIPTPSRSPPAKEEKHKCAPHRTRAH